MLVMHLMQAPMHKVRGQQWTIKMCREGLEGVFYSMQISETQQSASENICDLYAGDAGVVRHST